MLRNNYGDNQVLGNPVVANVGVSPLTKTTNAFNYTVNGAVYTKVAGNLPAFTGATIAAGSQTMYAFYIDNLGNYTIKQGNVVLNTTQISALDMPVAPTVTVVNNTNTVTAFTLVGIMQLVNVTNPFIPGTTNLDAVGVTNYYSNGLIFGL